MCFRVKDINKYAIDESYKQSFINIKNDIEYSVAINSIEKNFNIDIVKEICKLLYRFKFATKDQIISIVNQQYYIDEEFNFEELSNLNFIKEFILVKEFVDCDYDRNEGNTIYAIGPNGVNLIIDYIQKDVPRWEFKNISRGAQQVIKHIQVVDICINMIESFKSYNIVKYSVGPIQRRALGNKIDIDFEWSIDDKIRKNFLVLIIRNSDLKESFNQKVFKLEQFLSEKGKWRYDYIDIAKRPQIIFICEDEENMKLVARKLRGSSLNKDTLLIFTHDLLLKENLLKNYNALKVYTEDKNNLKEYEILREDLILDKEYVFNN